MRKKSRIELNNLEIVTILLTLVGNGTEKNPAKRWEEFTRLLASPRLPSGLL